MSFGSSQTKTSSPSPAEAAARFRGAVRGPLGTDFTSPSFPGASGVYTGRTWKVYSIPLVRPAAVYDVVPAPLPEMSRQSGFQPLSDVLM